MLKEFKGSLEPIFNNLKEESLDKSDNDAELKDYPKLPISFLKPSKYQPRVDFSEEGLEELCQSIRSEGLVQPLVVRKLSEESYEIVAGERRFRAAKLAGLEEVPVIIRALDDQSVLAVALVENLQREDLKPLEEAEGLYRLSNEFGLKHDQIAEIVGKSRSTVTNLLRILSLEDEVKSLLRAGELDLSHAKILLSLSGMDQIKAAHLMVSKKMTVREGERLVHQILNPSEKVSFQLDPIFEEQLNYWKKSCSEYLSSQVNFQFGKGGQGRMVIHFDSPEEINFLMKKILTSQIEEEVE